MNKSAQEILSIHLKECFETHREKISDKYHGYLLRAMKEFAMTNLLSDFPENRPLYKDSGLWQMRSDDMQDVLVQQKVNESDAEFIERCKNIKT